jgi:hypothetical protein
VQHRGINNTPFHRHQQESTNDNYQLQLLGLLAMLLRPAQSSYELCLTKQVESLVGKLKRALEEEEGDKKKTALCAHELLMAMWTTKWLPAIGDTLDDPTICYLALTMVETDGSIKEAKYATTTIARLEYCMRLMFLVQMGFMKLNGDSSSSIEMEDAAEELAPWYTEKVESTFNSLQSLMHRASSIAYSTMCLPRIWWSDRTTYQSMLYKGDKIEFSSIEKAMLDMEAAAVDLWEAKVMCGTGLRMAINYAEVTDDLTNVNVGYSFLFDPRNRSLQQHSTKLAENILSDPALRQKFIVGHDPETHMPVWNKPALRTWLHDYAKFEAIQLCRVEMTGGAPGRGTELAAMNLCNTRTRSKRNLCMLGQHLSVLRMYHKSGGLTGHDKLIPHALDGLTSDLLIQDLVLARPFACLAAKMCFPDQPQIHQLYQERLFINNGVEFETSNLTSTMARFTLPHVGIGLGVNAWRHISKAFKEKLCNRMMEVLEDGEEESVDAAQAGRRRETGHRVYGVSHDTLDGMAEDVLPLFLDSSTDWQKMLRVVPGGMGLTYHESMGENFADMVKSGAITLTPKAQTDMDKMADRIADIVTKRMERMFEQQLSKQSDKGQVNNSESSSPAPVIITDQVCYYHPQSATDLEGVVLVPDTPDQGLEPWGVARKIMSTTDTVEIPAAATTVDLSMDSGSGNHNAQLEAAAKEMLRKVLHKPHAEWTCEEQKQAVLELLLLKHDVLAILRTGAGKTMLPVIASQLEKNKVTVVVLPLKSLVSDYIRRLQDMGVQYELYEGQRQLTGAHGLILVSPDMAKQPRWRQSLAELNECCPVVRLVFDEGHFALTGSNYRSALRNLYELRTIPMQLVILSATIPPTSQGAIVDAFGLGPNTVVIRTPSDRPELEYVLEPRQKNNEEVTARVKSILARHLPALKTEDRVLIFVPYIDEGIQIAKCLGCNFYRGGKTNTDTERQEMMQAWIHGQDQVMVCTSAFGAGNDYPHVRLVIHAGSPLEMLGFG